MQDYSALFYRPLRVFLFVTLYHSDASLYEHVFYSTPPAPQAPGICYNVLMRANDTQEVVQALRERLEPIEHAHILPDAVEGLLPYARKAAVLLPLFEQDGEPYLVFIRRASTLRAHSGEIAFPGGGSDLTDTSPIMTALREAEEEIGLNPTCVEVLGILPPVFTVVSNYLVLPVVAFLPHGLGDLQLQATEVTELILAS